MSSKHTEKVICLYCDKEVTRKNLDSHNKTKHNGKKLHYKSAVSKDISSLLFGSSSSTPQPMEVSPGNSIQDDDGDVVQETSPDVPDAHDPPSKLLCLSTENEFNEVRFVQLTNKISELSSQVTTLIDIVNKQNRQEQQIHMGDALSGDERRSLILHARGVDSINKWLDDWEVVDGGLKCRACSKTINYDHDTEGREFDDENKLPQSFKNLKTSVLRHLDSSNHLKSRSALISARKEEKEAMENAKICGINCASVAYTNMFFSESRKSYEHHITDVYTCGGLVGTKNHSKRFPELLLPHLYNVLRTDVRNFIVSSNLPYDILETK